MQAGVSLFSEPPSLMPSKDRQGSASRGVVRPAARVFPREDTAPLMRVLGGLRHQVSEGGLRTGAPVFGEPERPGYSKFLALHNIACMVSRLVKFYPLIYLG